MFEDALKEGSTSRRSATARWTAARTAAAVCRAWSCATQPFRLRPKSGRGRPPAARAQRRRLRGAASFSAARRRGRIRDGDAEPPLARMAPPRCRARASSVASAIAAVGLVLSVARAAAAFAPPVLTPPTARPPVRRPGPRRQRRRRPDHGRPFGTGRHPRAGPPPRPLARRPRPPVAPRGREDHRRRVVACRQRRGDPEERADAGPADGRRSRQHQNLWSAVAGWRSSAPRRSTRWSTRS